MVYMSHDIKSQNFDRVHILEGSTVDNNRILTADAELVIRELEQRWNTEMGVKVA